MNKILILFFLFTVKSFTQTQTNLCFAELRKNIDKKKTELINTEIDSFFKIINCEIKGINLTEYTPPNYSYGCAMSKTESVKVKSILLFFSHREPLSVEKALKPIELKERIANFKNYLTIEIFIKNFEDYSFFEKLKKYGISPLQGNNWNKKILSKLLNDKYYVKDIVVK